MARNAVVFTAVVTVATMAAWTAGAQTHTAAPKTQRAAATTPAAGATPSANATSAQDKGAQTQDAPGGSTSDGVYTVAQAAAGQKLYAQVCETCHQPAKFSGAEFNRAYVGRTLSVIDHAMGEMPLDNPGSLTADDVASLIAYFLQMNKYPAGEKPLSGAPEVLKSIMVAPQP